MSEWKRVFLDPRRLGFLALTAVLCLAAFMLPSLDEPSLRSVGRTVSVSEYVSGLVERWRGKPPEEVAALAGAEQEKLLDVQDWYYGSIWAEPVFKTQDQALAAAEDMPYLRDALVRRDDSGFVRAINAYYSAVDTVRDEAVYLAGYSQYLEGIQSQAQIQAQTGLFGKPGSFSRRNLAKTARDFGALLGVEVEFGNSRGVQGWLDFRLGDYFHLAAIAVIVMAFLEERRRGLWPVVRATRGGRARLGAARIGILAAGSLLATVLYSLLPFVLSMGLHGGWDSLDRPLQSVESFGACPLRITVAQWLLRFFAVKLLSGILIGLLLWCVLGSITNPQFSVAVLGVTLAVEFILYEYLPVQSFLNILKYFNIFSYVHTSTLYTEYLNVDLFGFPVGIRRLSLWGIAIFGAGLSLWVLAVQASRRPVGNRDHLSRLSAPVEKALDRLRGRLGLGDWEGYKSLMFQYGAALMVLIFLCGGELTFLRVVGVPTDRWYDSYLNDMEGPIDGGTDEYLSIARDLAADSEDSPALLDALDRLEARVEVLRDQAREGGYEPWVVRQFDYEIAYGPRSQDQQTLNAAIAILLTALPAASLWPFERQSGVVPMLRSTPAGRRRLFRKKAVWAGFFAVFVWGCVYIRELLYFLREYPAPTTLAAPVGNLDSFAAFPIHVTILQYLLLLYAVRLLMLIGVAETAMSAGLMFRTVRASLLAVTAVLGVPALLASLGIDMFKWLSPVVPVASAQLAWSMGGGSLIYILPWLAWLTISTAILLTAKRKWLKRT